MQIADIFKAVADFFDGQFLAILVATSILFLIMYITWWVYRTLSKRNIFSLSQTSRIPTSGDELLYILKYFFIFPIYSFLGFLIFSLALFLLMKPATSDQHTTIFFVAIVIISTMRVGAYVHEMLAEDLAKLIPLSMLSIILTHPTFEGIGITFTQIIDFITLVPTVIKYLVFIIILEAVLRGSTWLFGNLNRDDAPSEK